MLYCCENCGKKYSTEEEAVNCEKAHAKEKAKREELAKTREDRANEIRDDYKALNEKYEQYFKDYGIYPNIGRGADFSPFDRCFITVL